MYKCHPHLCLFPQTNVTLKTILPLTKEILSMTCTTHTPICRDRGQQGFTLVELAIVMIIIGLLIAGVLKGQELIGNAKVTATVAQIKGLDAAISTFRDQYNALPGDMASPETRLPNCAADPCGQDGNNNARIDTPNLGNVPGAAQEGFVAWTHLSAADLITGIDQTATVGFGQGLPKAEIGGGYFVGFTNDGTAASLVGGNMRAGHYLAITGNVANIAAATGVVTPAQAARIDRKIDDGNPGTGVVHPAGDAGCIDGAVYNEDSNTVLCSLYIRIQN